MKKLPNNPLKAYQVGKVEGTKDNMDLVSMALLDKCGWHLRSEDAEDRQSIEFLFFADDLLRQGDQRGAHQAARCTQDVGRGTEAVF